jgi:hypothetical protein
VVACISARMDVSLSGCRASLPRGERGCSRVKRGLVRAHKRSAEPRPAWRGAEPLQSASPTENGPDGHALLTPYPEPSAASRTRYTYEAGRPRSVRAPNEEYRRSRCRPRLGRDVTRDGFGRPLLNGANPLGRTLCSSGARSSGKRRSSERAV